MINPHKPIDPYKKRKHKKKLSIPYKFPINSLDIHIEIPET